MVLTTDKLMEIDNNIWTNHGWKSGDEVNLAVYRKDLKKRIGSKKFSEKVYDELEDQNFHTLNEALADNGNFKQPFQKRIKKSYVELRKKYPRKLKEMS